MQFQLYDYQAYIQENQRFKNVDYFYFGQN